MGSVFSYGAHLTPRGMVLTWLVWKGKSKDDEAINSRRVDVFIPFLAPLRSASTFHLVPSCEIKLSSSTRTEPRYLLDGTIVGSHTFPLLPLLG